MRRLTLLSTLFLLLAACSGKSPFRPTSRASPASSPLPTLTLVIPHDTLLDIHLLSDSGQSYYIYSPTPAHELIATPVIIFFDPHGSGSLPVEKYRKLADKFGVVLVGSNDSKNGQNISESTQIANNIISDLSTHLGLNNTNICLSGFSGGAKVALYTGYNNSKINNVIYSGGSIPFSANHPIHLLGFAGTEDMNYTDLLQFSNATSQTNPEANQLVEFHGKHEWPDTVTFRKAFYWLTFQTWRQYPSTHDTAVIVDFKRETDKSISILEKQNAPLNAYLECQTAISFLNGLSDVTGYKNNMANLASTATFKAQQQVENETFQKEASEKQTLMSAFQLQDGGWWYKTINHYKSSSSPSDKRLLGFISLACYSYSSQLLARNDTAGAAHFLSIYALADPTNTDQLYFNAMLYAQENKPEQAIMYLSKAVENGFKDWQKIESEPVFTPLRGYESYSRLVTFLKKSPR
jgi:predicted esterase